MQFDVSPAQVCRYLENKGAKCIYDDGFCIRYTMRNKCFTVLCNQHTNMYAERISDTLRDLSKIEKRGQARILSDMQSI